MTALAASHGYGQEELVAAIDRYAHGARTPAEYRALAVEVERVSPRFNAPVAGEAARNLTFLALDPLDAHFDQPPAAQLEALALTVWPTALGEPPAAGEDAWAYTERLCAGPLSDFCKQIVPEHRALMLSQLVWSRLRERARAAMQECAECQVNPRYSDAIARFEQRDAELSARAGEVARRAHPKHWPIAGAHAAPWSGPPVVTLRGDGTARLEADAATGIEARELPPAGWSKALVPARAAGDTLGVWIGPGGNLGRLRGLAEAARTAGFRQLAIQARAPQFPYELREYRVALARRGTVPLRDADSIQLMISALDHGLAAGEAVPAL